MFCEASRKLTGHLSILTHARGYLGTQACRHPYRHTSIQAVIAVFAANGCRKKSPDADQLAAPEMQLVGT